MKGAIKRKLSDVCTIIAGQSPESKYYNQDGIGLPFFQGKADFGDLYPTIRTYCSTPTKIAQKNDILLSVRAPVGATNLAPTKVCIGRGLTAIRPADCLSTKYLLLFFRYFQAELAQKGAGTTFNAITQTVVKNIEIPVPSISSQERLVSKIEELFSEIDNGISALETAKRKLAVYRQVVITSAFPELSANNSVTLQEIAAISSGITKGRKLEGADILSLPYLRVANVQNGYLNLREIKEIQLKQSELARFLLEIDDVLYTEGGDRDKLGRGTVWRGEIPRCAHQNHIFKARLFKEKAVPQYVAYWSMTTPARNYFYEKGKQSVNLASINKTVLSKLPLPLPSLEKQSEIVSTIDQHLSVCNEIENTINKNLQAVAALKQSILKKAFEGNLL